MPRFPERMDRNLPARQRGVILVVCLVLLVVLTLIATGGMQSTIVEERMAGNLQDYDLAFQAAESALEEAESWLDAQVLLPSTSADGSTHVWLLDAPDPDTDSSPWWDERDATWWGSKGHSLSGLAEVSTQPDYVIEEYFSGFQGQSLNIGTGGFSSSRVIHRITGRGVGANANTEVLLQSTFIRPYD